ncbi:hypothetical protein GGI03_001031, partial [Coemansia sp. RSA 2337]
KFANPKESVQFMLNITPHAPVRKICSIYPKLAFTTIVPIFAENTRIQTFRSIFRLYGHMEQ